MNRRELMQMLALLGAGAGAWRSTATAAHPGLDPAAPRPRFVCLVYPHMLLLDLVPALTAFDLTMGDIELVWKERRPLAAEPGLSLQPTRTFDEVAPGPDVLFVPGGMRGTAACMEDPELLAFLARIGGSARYVTSVCTGSLVLGAAGLLRGYRATGYWPTLDLLPRLGAIVARDRVVVDRNRITGGGITAGLDFGLMVASAIRGENWAKTIQLALEYAPAPPFDAGTPESAGPELSATTRRLLSAQLPLLERAATLAGARLKS